MASGKKSRAAALALLEAVLERHQALDDAVASALEDGGRLARLEARDRAFARLLASTVLRHLGQLDEVIGRCLERPLGQRLSRLRNTLRLGAAQILLLDTPAHAAVDGTVRLLGAKSPFRGLVNAVLRRLVREGEGLLADLDGARLNTPKWLWQSWCAAYGEATARAIASAHLADPTLDISVKHDAAGWARRLDAVVLPGGSLRRALGGRIEELPGFNEGAWWVQDAAAALPAKLLTAVLEPGQAVVDLCAAPGGKTAQLALSQAVTAVDLAAKRLETLAANLQRLGLEAQTVAADVAAWQPAETPAGVLLDAPCSATGTMRRHPDVAHLKRPGDVVRLAGLQARLLEAAVAMLGPGGVLVYCVCSLQPAEGPERVAALLADHPELQRQPIAAAEVAGLSELISPEGDLRTLPCHLAEQGGLDGFYAARLRRQG